MIQETEGRAESRLNTKTPWTFRKVFCTLFDSNNVHSKIQKSRSYLGGEGASNVSME